MNKKNHSTRIPIQPEILELKMTSAQYRTIAAQQQYETNEFVDTFVKMGNANKRNQTFAKKAKTNKPTRKFDKREYAFNLHSTV